MTGEGVFSSANHLLELREERCDKIIRDDVSNAKLKELFANLDGTNHCLILHTKNTGAWLKVRVTIVTGTVFTETEFCRFYAHVMIIDGVTR